MSRHTLFLLLSLTLLLTSATPAPPLAPLPPERSIFTSSPPSFGLNSHLATRYPDPSSMHGAASTVRELGVTWVREDLHWHRIQPAPDVWDWTFTDAALRELRQRDIHILGVLGPSVGWATPFPDDAPDDVSFYPPDPDAFVAYARAVVTRYRRHIKHWEIWNEPDTPLFWKPAPDPQAYADLLMRTSRAIKEIDPEAQVLIGGFNPFDLTFVRAVTDAGAWDSFDILAIHPYVDPASPEQGNLPAALDKVHVLMDQAGTKPIWATEIGWSSGPGDRDLVGHTDAQEQASFLIRSLLLLWSAGVERSFWYMLKDDAHNPYGLVAFGNGRSDFRTRLRKPAFAALRTLNRALEGTRLLDRRDLFDRATLIRFEDTANWRRTDQPNGRLAMNQAGVAQVQYNFSTAGNDYLVFERIQAVPIPEDAYALGGWVYGDGSDQEIKVWVRDAEGELLQFTLGIAGGAGWRFIATPIGQAVPPDNRIEGPGNGLLDFPASLVALVIDDATDAYIGISTIYLDDLTAVRGREVYDVRLERGTEALDVLWSPPGIHIAINTSADRGRLVAPDGTIQSVEAQNGRFLLRVGPDPLFLWHAR